MFLNRTASIILLAFAVLSGGCREVTSTATQAGTQATKQQVAARTELASAPALAQPTAPQRETARSDTPQAAQAAQSPLVDQPSKASVPDSSFEEVEERKGPFTIGGQTFTVVLHSIRLPGQNGDFAKALESLDIVNAGGVVQHHQEFPHTIEDGSFSESCSATVNTILGSNGAGFLVDTGCLPSAPLSGGPWQMLGANNGKLTPIGKPLYAEGEMGDFVPGMITKIGSATQILADELRIRLFTGYFFVVVPVRVNWMEGRLALAQHCYYQTGHGAAEGGCEMPVENVERHPGEQELTFVRMFTESNEQVGTPDHVVIKKDTKVEILAAKVLVTWKEAQDGIRLGVGDDIWVKVRINDKVGWIHTNEDLQAIGLYQAG